MYIYMYWFILYMYISFCIWFSSTVVFFKHLKAHHQTLLHCQGTHQEDSCPKPLWILWQPGIRKLLGFAPHDTYWYLVIPHGNGKPVDPFNLTQPGPLPCKWSAICKVSERYTWQNSTSVLIHVHDETQPSAMVQGPGWKIWDRTLQHFLSAFGKKVTICPPGHQAPGAIWTQKSPAGSLTGHWQVEPEKKWSWHIMTTTTCPKPQN